MNTDFLIDGVLRSVLGGRRRQSHRALHYLTRGGSSFLLSNPTALLTAAGMAWGIFETLQGETQSGSVPPALGGMPAEPASSGGAQPVASALPPLPVVGTPGTATATAAPVSGDAQRIVRLAIAAAYADGALSDDERAAVLAQAEAAGVRNIVDEELQRRRPLAEIVAGVGDTAQRATLYVLAFSIVRADEAVTGADRIFLAQLAHLLGLDPATVTRLEDEAARRIDTSDGAAGADPAAPAGNP
jgi:tellurite resistance protein